MVVGWQFLRTSARTVRLGHMYLDTIVWWVFEIRTYGSHGGDWEWAIIYLFVRISKQPRNFRYPKARKLSESSSRKNFCIFEFRLSNSNPEYSGTISIALLSQFVTMLRCVLHKKYYIIIRFTMKWWPSTFWTLSSLPFIPKLKVWWMFWFHFSI